MEDNEGMARIKLSMIGILKDHRLVDIKNPGRWNGDLFHLFAFAAIITAISRPIVAGPNR